MVNSNRPLFFLRTNSCCLHGFPDDIMIVLLTKVIIMTTGVFLSPKEEKDQSMEKLQTWIVKRKISEERGPRKSTRQEIVARSNARPLVITRRKAVTKPNLDFTGLGPWGF